MIYYNAYNPLLIRQANDVEESRGPAIVDIIDPTTTMSADSSVFSVKFYCNREK